MKKEELTALGLNEDQIKGVQKLTVLTSKQLNAATEGLKKFE